MNDTDKAVQAMIELQTRRAWRGVEKHCPEQLALFDALLTNGAGPLLRAVYQGGLSDGVRGVAGFTFDKH